MPNESFAKLAQMRKCIDMPRPAQAVYDECISISGWIFAETREPSACRVRAWLEGIPIVETRLLFARGDVSDFLSLPRDFPMAGRLRFWAGCCEKISTASPRPMNCAIIDKPTDV